MKVDYDSSSLRKRGSFNSKGTIIAATLEINGT